MNPPFLLFKPMKPQASAHFPQFRFADGQKWLFNPVLKKRFANRPEERVRLQYVEYLLHQTEFNKNRIGFEAPIKAHGAEHTLRADLVLYDRQMNPFALIECKSERAGLNDKTAQQAARYNQNLNAEYIMITNGINEFWYDLSGKSPRQTSAPLTGQESSKNIRNDNYWTERGFISSESQQSTVKLAHFFLKGITDETGSPAKYLNIPKELSPFAAEHYYFFQPCGTDQKIAFTLLNGGDGVTYLTAVLNRSGRSEGILWIDMDALQKDDEPVASISTPHGLQSKHVPESLLIGLQDDDPAIFENFGKQLLIFFD